MFDAPSTASRSPSPVVFATGEERGADRSSPARGEGGPEGWRGRLALAATLVPGAASAHEGHHETMALPEALRHLISQPDHQIMFAALVVLAIVGGWAWRRAAQ